MRLGHLLSYLVLGNRVPFPRRRRKPRRGPDQAEAYRAWIRRQPSCVSGLEGHMEAAHTGPRGLWQKSAGYTCIPLTHEEHMELHRLGPRKFQAKYGIDFAIIIEAYNAEWSEHQSRRAA